MQESGHRTAARSLTVQRITDASDLASRITNDATGAVITLGGDQIKLVGVSADELIGNLDAYVKIV